MNTPRETAVYDIHITGHLDSRRAGWFETMTITPLPDGTTRLSGPVPDQAALHGLLSRIRDLGVVLLSVQRREQGRAAAAGQQTDHQTEREGSDDYNQT